MGVDSDIPGEPAKIILRNTDERQKAKDCVAALFAVYPSGPVPGSCWIDEHNGYAEIAGFGGRLHVGAVYVAPECRKDGHGEAIMRLLMAKADEAGLEISLSAAPFGKEEGPNKGPTKQSLVRWYKTLGFEPSGMGDRMIRPAMTLDALNSAAPDRSVKVVEDQESVAPLRIKLKG